MQPWESECREKRKRIRVGEVIDHAGFMIVICAAIYGNLLYSCMRQRLQRSKGKKASLRRFYESAK